MSEENKMIVRQNYETVWNKGDLTSADQIYADSYVAHLAEMPFAIDSAETFKQFVALFRALTPGICFTVKDQLAEGDKVATRWTARMPSAENALVSGISIHRVREGKMTESWDNWDAMTAFHALGEDVFETLSLTL